MMAGLGDLFLQMEECCWLLGLLFASKGGEQSIEKHFLLLPFCTQRYVHACVVCICSSSCVHTYACRAQKSAVGYLPPSLLTFETRSLNLGFTSLPSLADQLASRYLPVSAFPERELQAHSTMLGLLCGSWGSNSGSPNLFLLTQDKKLDLEVSCLNPPEVLRWHALPAKEAGTLTAPRGWDKEKGDVDDICITNLQSIPIYYPSFIA